MAVNMLGVVNHPVLRTPIYALETIFDGNTHSSLERHIIMSNDFSTVICKQNV